MTDAAFPRDVNDTAPPKAKGRIRWPWLVVLALLIAASVIWARTRQKTPAASQGAAAGFEKRVVPVQVTTVGRVDIPIILEGLGSVVPLATVVVKSQVDGRLEKVFFKEGEQVQQGQLIAQVDPRPFQIQLQQGQAALARDRATANNARLNLERYTTLSAQHLVPQQQVDDQRTLVNQTEAAILADEAQVNSAKLNLTYARITSPVSGVTGVRLIDPGNIVHASDPTGIVVVTQLDPIAILFTLPEDDQLRVSQAMSKGPLQVDAYNRDGSKKLATGRLLLIDNQINTATATIRLKATFDNPEHALWPNAFVKARMTLDTRKGVLAIPNSAVQRGPQGTFVYVVKNDQSADVRPVSIDTVQDETTIIESGLAQGDLVVTEGQNQLRPGAKVSVRARNETQRSIGPASSSRPRNAQ